MTEPNYAMVRLAEHDMDDPSFCICPEHGVFATLPTQRVCVACYVEWKEWRIEEDKRRNARYLEWLAEVERRLEAERAA